MVTMRRLTFGFLANASGRLSSLAMRLPRLNDAALASLILLAWGFPFELLKPVAQVAFFTLSTVRLAALVALGLWALTRLAASLPWISQIAFQSRPAHHPFFPQRMFLPVAIWLAVLFVSARMAPSHSDESLKFTLAMLSGVLVGWAVFDLTYSTARLQLVAGALAIGGLAVTLIGLAEGADIPQVTTWLTNFRSSPTLFDDVLRVTSTLPHANTAAMVLELTLPLTFALALTTQRLWIRSLLAIGLLLGILTLVLTLSRAGIIGFLASVGVMIAVGVWARDRAVIFGSLATIAALFSVIGIVLLMKPFLIVRLISDGSDELWYRATYQVPISVIARPEENLRVPITLTNTGLRAWEPSNPRPFNLSYHLIRLTTFVNAQTQLNSTDEVYVTFSGQRTALPVEVPPGATVEVIAQVVTPSQAGDYWIEWDMIQEGVTWFSKKGTPSARTRLVIEGRSESDDAITSSPPPKDVPTQSQDRLVIWQSAWQMALAHPWLGVGPYSFHWNYQSYVGSGRGAPPHAHNLYFEWLADTGFLGLGAFLWVAWVLVKSVAPGLKLRAHGERVLWVWWLALSASLAAWFTHGVFDFFFNTTPTLFAFWIVAGLSASAAARCIFDCESKRPSLSHILTQKIRGVL